MITYVELYLASSVWGLDIIDTRHIKSIGRVTYNATDVLAAVLAGEHYTVACELTDENIELLQGGLACELSSSHDSETLARIHKSLWLLGRITDC